MSDGIVLSDLHLFSSRADQERINAVLASLPSNLGFMVLNGDIFDFRWSRFKSEAETISASLAWLRGLEKLFPGCHFYYIMGNHDGSSRWAAALATMPKDRFTWSPTHCFVGSSLFLHGDLPLQRKNPYQRVLPDIFDRVPAFNLMSPLYDGAVAARIPHLFKFFFRPEQCVPKIHNLLTAHDPGIINGAKDIYFGHTHVPFSGYHHQGVRYHNTGSGIRHMPGNMMRIADGK